MSKSKRKTLIRIAERVALAILVVDVLLYSVLVLGLSDRIRAAAQTRDNLRRQIYEEQLRIVRLKKTQADLPHAQEELAQFEKKRVPSRREGYSRAAHLIQEVGQRSGVDIAAVSYKLDSERAMPLERLGISVTAQGLYPSLIKFAHDLETTGDFVVEREFIFQQGEGGTLALRISADLYLTR
jgi:Tfp pilus assembly protein PilO